MKRYGVSGEDACQIAGIFGISGACNLIGAIKQPDILAWADKT